MDYFDNIFVADMNMSNRHSDIMFDARVYVRDLMKKK